MGRRRPRKRRLACAGFRAARSVRDAPRGATRHALNGGAQWQRPLNADELLSLSTRAQPYGAAWMWPARRCGRQRRRSGWRRCCRRRSGREGEVRAERRCRRTPGRASRPRPFVRKGRCTGELALRTRRRKSRQRQRRRAMMSWTEKTSSASGSLSRRSSGCRRAPYLRVLNVFLNSSTAGRSRRRARLLVPPTRCGTWSRRPSAAGSSS